MASAGETQVIERRRRGPVVVGKQDQNVGHPVGGILGLGAGEIYGLGRGFVNGVQGAVESADFLQRVTDPFDFIRYPGHPAQLQALDAAGRALAAGGRAIDYTKSVIANPNRLVEDGRREFRKARVKLDPTATPAAPTFGSEFKRNFGVGANQGELAFNVGSLFISGPAAEARLLAGLSKEARVARHMDQGFSAEKAAYLAEPYQGMGSHLFPRRGVKMKDVPILREVPVLRDKTFKLPQPILDSQFNVLKPPGISRGEMYELHHRVDDRFHGAGLPKALGPRGWSGKAAGLERFKLPGRLWYGSPAPLKRAVTLPPLVGDWIYHASGQAEPR